jgi:hypothetical protein
VTITNDGTIEELLAKVDTLVLRARSSTNEIPAM